MFSFPFPRRASNPSGGSSRTLVPFWFHPPSIAAGLPTRHTKHSGYAWTAGPLGQFPSLSLKSVSPFIHRAFSLSVLLGITCQVHRSVCQTELAVVAVRAEVCFGFAHGLFQGRNNALPGLSPAHVICLLPESLPYHLFYQDILLPQVLPVKFKAQTNTLPLKCSSPEQAQATQSVSGKYFQ